MSDSVDEAFKKIANPVSPMTEAGIAMFSMFQTWIAGGFTEDQAMTLLARWMVESARQSSVDEIDDV